MVGTGHQYIVLAVCSLTVNHISLSKTHVLLYFCPQLDLLEVFPLFFILLFYTALWTQDLFVKASGGIYSTTHTLKSLADEHPFVS